MTVASALVGSAAVLSFHPLPFYDQHADEAFAHYNLGVLQARTGDYTAAVTSYQTSLRISPDNEYAMVSLGLLYVDTGQFEQARTVFDELTQLDPGVPDYWVALGDIYRVLGRADKARESFRRALALVPENAYVRNQLAS